MYQQGYNQNYNQYGSYGHHDGLNTGYVSGRQPYVASADPRIVLDDYNSDLNFVIEPDGLTGSSLHKDGFEYMWAGARATHGVKSGKVCFEVTVLGKLQVSMPQTETNPHVVRVGWSVDRANLQVGEDNLSYGYGGTGKVSVNNKFFDYGESYTSGDTISCCIDLDANPKVILFCKNGRNLGVAFRLDHSASGQVFFPHVTVKNMRLAVNFGQREPYSPPLQGFILLSRMPSQFLEKGSLAPLSRDQCEVIMMVGLPGCGKTTWAEKYAKDYPEKKFYILGTNTIMDRMKVMGLMRKRNYHGRWDALIKQATDVLNKVFKIAERKNRNYIVDQTNVYFNARRRKMNSFRGFRRIAAVIVNTNEVLKQRTEKREREEGKIVPESAVLEMKANFVLPQVGEVFDDVWFIEEDRAASECVVSEFQREGKEFKEGEKKRKPDEDSNFNGKRSSDVKRRPGQVGPPVPSHDPRDPYQGKTDHGGFHGNPNSREGRSSSHNEAYHGHPQGSRGAPFGPYSDYRPPLSSGRGGQPHGMYNTRPQNRQQETLGNNERFSESRYQSNYQAAGADSKYQSHYQPPRNDNRGYQSTAGQNRYQSHYQSPGGDNSKFQSHFQPPSAGGNSYSRPPPPYAQYGQCYSDQNTTQSYPQGQNFYSGGVGRGRGAYDQYGYGGGY